MAFPVFTPIQGRALFSNSGSLRGRLTLSFSVGLHSECLSMVANALFWEWNTRELQIPPLPHPTPHPPPPRSWDTSPLQHMDRSPDCSQGPESGEQEAGRGPVQQERNQINRTRRRSHSGIISPVRRLPNDPAQIQPGRRENGGSWLSGPK
jgi:hypothetical protein